MFFLKIKPFFRGYEVTGLRRLQGYEIAKSSIYLAISIIYCLDAKSFSLSSYANFFTYKAHIYFYYCFAVDIYVLFFFQIFTAGMQSCLAYPVPQTFLHTKLIYFFISALQ